MTMRIHLLAAMIILTTSFFFEVRADESYLQFKGQKQSIMPWDNLPVESFLNFKQWRDDQDQMAQVEEAERVVRERNHREVARNDIF